MFGPILPCWEPYVFGNACRDGSEIRRNTKRWQSGIWDDTALHNLSNHNIYIHVTHCCMMYHIIYMIALQVLFTDCYLKAGKYFPLSLKTDWCFEQIREWIPLIIPNYIQLPVKYNWCHWFFHFSNSTPTTFCLLSKIHDSLQRNSSFLAQNQTKVWTLSTSDAQTTTSISSRLPGFRVKHLEEGFRSRSWKKIRWSNGHRSNLLFRDVRTFRQGIQVISRTCISVEHLILKCL